MEEVDCVPEVVVCVLSSVTVTMQMPTRPFVLVAVITAVPADLAMTAPLVTVATAGSEDAQIRVASVEFGGVTVAVRM